MTGDQPLPGMPEPPPVTERQVPAGVRVTRIQMRSLCDDCCELIHRVGAYAAPLPRPARWRIKGDGYQVDCCESHKDERV